MKKAKKRIRATVTPFGEDFNYQWLYTLVHGID